MADNRIYDAINIFKYSPTGQGAASIGGDAAYQAKYRTLASAVVEKLWSLWRAGEIGFFNFGPGVVGDSLLQRPGHDIRVNTLTEPSNNPASYQSASNQGKLAATSCNLVHEATHLVSTGASYPEEEVICRAIQLFYFGDLKSPRSYQSRFANARCTVRFLRTTPFYHDYQFWLNRHLSRELIDTVLDIEEYRSDLESDATADFVKRSLPWWNGLSARWATTRGYYLRSLASRSGQRYGDEILTILESLTRPLWLQAKPKAGDLAKIRRALTGGIRQMNAAFRNRIIHVEATLGENFGIRSP